MNKVEKMWAAYRNGIKIPYQAMKVSEETGVPYPVLCAFLEQESYGGANVFGHDPTIFVGAGKVTKKKYAAYRAERLRTGKVQGVGPMQLTWGGFQDGADKAGGCWRSSVNLKYGADLLATYWAKTHDWQKVGKLYNGRDSYGYEIVAKIEKWKKIFNAK